MATKSQSQDDLEVGKCDSGVEVFYDDPKNIFTNESESDSDMESAISNELSDDLIELQNSFAKVQLEGKPLYKAKIPLRRARSEAARLGTCKPILRIVPGQSSNISIAQLEELKCVGMQDSLILRSMSFPCARTLSDGHMNEKIKGTPSEPDGCLLSSGETEDTRIQGAPLGKCESLENLLAAEVNPCDKVMKRCKGATSLMNASSIS